MNYVPHYTCLQGDPKLIFLFLLGNLMTAASYYVIPSVLFGVMLYRMKHHMNRLHPYTKLIGFMTALFIAFCGTTHIMSAWNIFHADYDLEAFVLVATGIISVPSALVYCLGLKWFLTFQSPIILLRQIEELGEANRHLQDLVDAHKGTNYDLTMLQRLQEAEARQRRAEARLREVLERETRPR